MDGIQISYLVDHPEYIPQLGQWLFEQWGSILGEETPAARIEKLKRHLNRDALPIAWVAHANGQVLGTAALRVHDLEDRQDLTRGSAEFWLGRSFAAEVSARRSVLPSRSRPGREGQRRFICSRSIWRRGIRALAGEC